MKHNNLGFQKTTLILGISLFTLFHFVTAHADTKTDKSNYHLFNPTPREEMREMSTDRPDLTESPYTVDAGHIQVEMSMFEIGHDAEKGESTRSYSVAPTNIKLGLNNSTDIQFVFSPYERERSSGPGGVVRTEGFGDGTLIRLKRNIWGNDEGSSAFGVMPFIKFPTGNGSLSNDHVEGGFITLYAHELPCDMSLGTMLEVDAEYNDARDSYGSSYLHTATVGFPIIGDLGGYLEYAGVIPNRTGGGYQALISSGLNYQVSRDILLDAGTRIGLSKSAEDQFWFTGLSFRS